MSSISQTALETAKHSIELAIADINSAKQDLDKHLSREQPVRNGTNVSDEQRNRWEEGRRKIIRLERTLEARIVMVERMKWQMGNAG